MKRKKATAAEEAPREPTGTRETVVLAIDPGTRRAGYAVLKNPEKPTAVEHGVIRMKDSLPIEVRLHLFHEQLMEIIGRVNPTIIAVEEPYIGRGAKASMAVGQAQAIALLAATSCGLPVRKYSPALVKLMSNGSGNASKDEVLTAVANELNIPDLKNHDEADALAVGLCHMGKERERYLETHDFNAKPGK